MVASRHTKIVPDVFSKEFLTASLEDSLQWFREKAVLTDEEFYELEGRWRARAFTVSDVTDLDLVSEVWRALDSAIENGTGYQDFRAAIGDKLAEEWGGENLSRLETIFRTNIQSAYSAGRYIQNNKPEVRATHPYSKLLVVEDDRTSEICESLDGTCLPSDDPFWASHQPPLHFNCRSDVVALSEEEAREEGIDVHGPDVEADDGFGNPLEPWEPDLQGRPTELSTAYEMKNEE